MGKELSFTEKLCYNSTRIETVETNGDVCFATGFFLGLKVKDAKDSIVVLLVTNRHVTENAERLHFHMTCADANGNPDGKKRVDVKIENARSRFILHPDKDIDLSVFPVSKTINDFQTQTNAKVFFSHFPQDTIMTDQASEELDAVENILMVGYPNGLWDEVNNRPIIRRGITATDPKVDYFGKREFIIDCACIQGSSGSPVLSFDKGMFFDKYVTKSGTGVKTMLLGVQHAIPVKNAQGEIVKTATPIKGVEANTQIPINLGYIIKAQCLLDFIPLVEKRCGLVLERP